jgi:hypothetical protein
MTSLSFKQIDIKILTWRHEIRIYISKQREGIMVAIVKTVAKAAVAAGSTEVVKQAVKRIINCNWKFTQVDGELPY